MCLFFILTTLEHVGLKSEMSATSGELEDQAEILGKKERWIDWGSGGG